MNKYNTIVKALEELIRLAYLTRPCSVTFGIRPRNHYHFYDPALFPAIMVNAKTDGEGVEIEDMTLSISLFLDGDHENESKELFEKLSNSKLKEYFRDFPEKYDYRPLYADLGKDINIIAGVVIQAIYTLSKCQDFEIVPQFNTYLDIKGKEGLDKLKLYPAEISPAVKNAFDTGVSMIGMASISIDIMREHIEGYDFLGNVVINEEDEGGYRAFITMAPFINRPLDLFIRNLKEYRCIRFCESCLLRHNSFELIITFRKTQEDAFLQLLTQLFKEFNPSLQITGMAAQLDYHNFVSKPTICLQYLFHADGSGPSDRELKYGRELIDNLEVEIEEDGYFDP